MSDSNEGVLTLNSASYTATFASKSVANGIAVTVTGLALAGAQQGNYTLTQPTGVTGNISPKALTVTGITVTDHVYDGLTNATLNLGSALLQGTVSGDAVSLNSSGYTATFASKNVANGIAVTVSGLALTGAQQGNYTLTQPTGLTGNITPKALTVTGITVVDHVYDGLKNATLNLGSATLPELVSGDAVSVNTSGYMATFASKDVANGIAVTVSGLALTGTQQGNYTLTQPTGLTGNITPKALTATLTAADKVYDGIAMELDASMHCALPAGSVVGLDDVGCAATNGTFNSSQVLTASNVTATVALTGATAGNYSLTSPTATAAAHITPKAVTVTFIAADKTYDATSTATVSNCVIATGKVSGDDLACTVANGTFASKNANTNAQTVSATATLTGSAASNYAVTNPVTTMATISPAPITITADPKTKIYGTGDPALTYQVTNGALITLFGSDSFSGGLTRVSGENVGTYAIQQGTLAAGPNYTITYAGANLTITQASSATVVLSSVNPSVFGQNVAFTATVTDSTPGSAGTPTGSVQFYIDGTPFGVAVAVINGQASSMTSALSVASHGVYAKYAGDLDFVGSTSGTVSQLVNKADTSVTVTSSGSPSTLNSPVTYTAMVSVAAPGAGAPTGTVTFYLDSTSGTQLGSAGVASGKASIVSSAVPVNQHKIVAVYSGDGSFNGNSGSVNQVVQYASLGICDGEAGHQILQPINFDGTSVFKQKSTVPAKFRVCDAGGNSIGTPGVVTSFYLVQTQSGTVVTNIDESVDSTTPDATFRWDPPAQQWIFNMNTKSLTANVTYYYTITLNDGSTIQFMFGLK